MAEDLLLGAAAPDLGSYDNPDLEAERQQRAQASLKVRRLRKTGATILSTQEGREWLWSLLASAHTFEHRIAMSASDYENGFWAGEREVGLELYRVLARGNPQHFAMMHHENDAVDE